MTIKQQIRFIIEHPYYQEALRDESCMEKLLFEVMFGVYGTVAGNCSRVYRMNKRMNGPDIVTAIRDIEPPVNLDVRLPFVVPREVAPVVKMQVAHVMPELRIRYPKHPVERIVITNQLPLWDTKKPIEPVMADRLSELREG